MGRLKWWLLAGLAGLFVAYLAWVGWRGPEVKLYRVTQAELMQTIVASGHVQNPNRIEVSAQITSTVDSVPVKEGEFVKKGQLLISLNSHEAQAGLQVAKAAAKSAQHHLQQLQQVNEPVAALALLQADANLVVSQRNYQRTKELYEQSFVGLAAKEESERLWLIAQSQSLINKKQWLSLQASGSEISSAESNLQEALANVNVALAKLAYTRILAARSGVLISRHVEAGDAVQPGKPLLVLSPEGQSEIVVLLDEKNMKWVKAGQVGWAVADAFADKLFRATVSFINPGVDPLRGSVEVKLKVDPVPDYLKQDMTVTVEIEVVKLPMAIQVPLSVVHDADKPDAWVYVAVDGKAVKKTVSLGLKAGSQAQIMSGLQAGDWVVFPSAASLHDGSAIHSKNH
jgi:HlyD family secretion protein